MRIFGSDRAKIMMDRFGIAEDEPIEAKLITRSIEKAQVRVEGHHFDARKHLLEYDDVLNKHREIIYARRREVLESFANEPEKLRDRILDIIEGEVEQMVLFHSSEVDGDAWDVKEIMESVGTIVSLTEQQKQELKTLGASATQDKEGLALGRTSMIGAIMENIREQYDKLTQMFDDRHSIYNIERAVILRAMDMLWIDHLAAMTALRTGIGLQGYGQRDPLVEYKKEGYQLFQHLLGSINNEITQTFFKYAKHAVDMKVQAELGRSVFQKAGLILQGAQKTSGPLGSNASDRNDEKVGLPAVASAKVGRNDPCPCGSGKKFKKCHGA
jgi:preprotein translocase subunit SecA